MPFKDVDLEKLAENKKVHKNLYRNIAENNKLTSSTIEDDKSRLPLVELISGKKVQSLQRNPVDIVQSKLDLSEATKPITDRLKKISDNQQEIIHKQILPVPPPVQYAIDAPPEPGLIDSTIDIDTLPGLTMSEEDLQTVKAVNPNFDNLNQVFINYYHSPLEFLRFKSLVVKELNKLKGFKGALERDLNQKLVSESDYDTRKAEIQSFYEPLRRYNEALKVIQKAVTKRGKGRLSIGDYWIDRKKLNRDNILSVRYNSNNNMVGKFGARRVSDNVKNAIKNNRVQNRIQLSEGEKQYLDKLYLNAGSKLSPSKAQLIRGGEIFTSMEEMSDKLNVILGQIKAGNTSKVIRNEAMDIVHYLYKNKKIKKDSYNSIIDFLSNR